jgi:hypothetical protein
MGMYTEFVLVAKVRGDAPAEVIEMLKVMCTGGANEVDLSNLNHPFFSLGRAPWMLQCSSYYHTPASVSQFEHNDIGKFWTLIVRCDLKNYEDEIDQFVDWVTPYLDVYENDHLGWKKYEEDTVPTLLFHPNKWLTPSFPELE